jgi:hypothetical protein
VVREEEGVTVDREELKRLAEAAQGRHAYFEIHAPPESLPFIHAANPYTVLDLLAELEAAEKSRDSWEWHAKASAGQVAELHREVKRLREVAIAAWTDLFAGEPGEVVAARLWDAVVSAVAGKERSS